MKEEISAAVVFLTKLIGKSDLVLEDKIEKLSTVMCQLLEDRYQNHWHPEKPTKGQAYRCIRVNENDRRDPTLVEACQMCDIKYEDLRLPIEMTLWVDPEEVTCRFGEHKGSYCIVAKFSDGNQENYIDQINIDELEKESVKRAKQASFDMLNSSRKRRNKYNKLNGYSNSNGYHNSPWYGNDVPADSKKGTWADYLHLIPNSSANTSGYYGSFYGSSPPHHHNPYINGYSSSPPHQMFNKYPVSPPQSRQLYRNGGSGGKGFNGLNVGNSSTNGSSKFSGRGLQNAFTSAAPFSLSYTTPTKGDRFHYVNNSVVKA